MLINRLSIRYQSSRYKSFEEIIKYERQEQDENHCLRLRRSLRGFFCPLLPLIKGTVLQPFAEHANDVFSVAFSADGEWIASSGEDKRVVCIRCLN